MPVCTCVYMCICECVYMYITVYLLIYLCNYTPPLPSPAPIAHRLCLIWEPPLMWTSKKLRKTFIPPPRTHPLRHRHMPLCGVLMKRRGFMRYIYCEGNPLSYFHMCTYDLEYGNDSCHDSMSLWVIIHN